ncbi:unnamed protein product [Leptosia nina]|uniref:Uncharacterized protein n=1 Tax=Leptosia nina TaxID=320188 RepID=A0AAV1JRT9_9NEOP
MLQENENIVKDEGKLKVPEDVEYIKKETVNTRACWPKFEVTKYYKILDNLDDKYAEVRQNYQAAVGVDNFDADMLAMLIKSGGVAERTAYVSGDRTHIPAGINLGGYSMMRVPKNILFFHRMKLRNDTHFRVQYLQNDLENMVLRSRIALNDLRVMGSFDRAITDSNPSNLFYVPTFGKAEFLLKNVKYSMEGRYRLIQNTLNLVLVISELKVDDVIMVVHGFLDRLKTDLDHWLKDYFNDYLTYYSIAGRDLNSEFQKYDAEKALALNDFTDNAINVIIRKLHRVKAGSVKLPNFTIYALNGMVPVIYTDLPNLFLVHKIKITPGLEPVTRETADTKYRFLVLC